MLVGWLTLVRDLTTGIIAGCVLAALIYLFSRRERGTRLDSTFAE